MKFCAAGKMKNKRREDGEHISRKEQTVSSRILLFFSTLLGIYDPVARIRRVKSTYVETFDQELFLKNMPKAIDSRILRESPILAMAIAAEHLIQVFHTHGSSMEKSAIAKDVGKKPHYWSH